MRILSRRAWGARPPTGGVYPVTWPQRTGFVVHHSGASRSQTVQAIQDYHMDDNGWGDVGYHWLVRANGDIYEGRGWYRVGAHAHGHNTATIGVCVIGDYTSRLPSAAARASVAYLLAEAERMKGAGLEVLTHRQVGSTKCPGTKLHGWVISKLAGYAPAKPSAGKPVTGSPPPGPAYAWPLPRGHYFGPRDGGDRSVSGFYGRRFGGVKDHVWLERYTRQLAKRGWPAGEGQKYLTRYGHDGRYGDEVGDLTEAFQRDKGLNPDRLPGPITWAAAFKSPVT